MVTRRPQLSVVIPAFDEASCIRETLDRLSAFGCRHDWPMEVVVVDDGSTDGTGELARQFPGRPPVTTVVLRQPVNRGKGAAVKLGVSRAGGELIAYMDADLSYDLAALETATEEIMARGADVVVGDRTHPESRYVRPYPWFRKLTGQAFSVLIQVFLFREVFDTQCGFKCFRRDAGRELFPILTIPGFGFDVEFLFLAARRGKRIARIPVVLNHSHDSKVRLVRDSITMLGNLFEIKRNYRRGTYGPGA